MSLFAAPGAAALAETLAWLWRLGPPLPEPSPDAVGIGLDDRAASLAADVKAGRLAAAVVLTERGRRRAGRARFETGESVAGEFVLLDGGEPAVRSSLGAHAVRHGGVLAVGARPGDLHRLDGFWLAPALSGFVAEALRRPLELLPPIGCLRLDDAPGTAELQLQGAAKTDARERRRLERMLAALRRSGARLTVAVAAQALDGDRAVPIDEVWPRATETLAQGVREGLLEPACHGLLHLDEAARAEGRIEAREFAHLDEREAGRRLDTAIAWMSPRLGAPRTFVAPAWSYSPGALAAAAERRLRAWTQPQPGPLVDGFVVRETLLDGLPGLDRLDYAPLARLAEAGVPPTVVFHGRLLDGRVERLRAGRDVVSLARLALRRDLDRIASLAGVEWVGAAEFADRVEAHGRDGDGAVLLHPDGRRVSA